MTTSYRFMLLPIVLLAIGCRDATAPKPPFQLAVQPSQAPVTTISTNANGPVIQCDVEITASATGTGSAKWQDGVMRYYAGANRTAPVDSEPVTAVDLQAAWGATITAGYPQASQWRFAASLPFEVEIELRYLPDGGTAISAAKTRFACGSVPPAGTTAPPVVSRLSVTPATGEIQAGGGIDITYDAYSSWGVWAASVDVSGAFASHQVFAESGATSVTRTVHLEVPPGAQYGVPVTVVVQVVDPGYQQGGRSVQTQTVVVDRTAPTLSFAFLANGPSGLLAGQFAVGESMQLVASASDNDALRWLVWELGAPANVKDSIAAPPAQPYVNWNALIKVKPEWIGSPILSVYVRDAAGNRSASTSSAPDSVRIFPLVARLATPVSAPSGGSVGELAFDAKRGVFYIPLTGTNNVAVLDATTMTYRAPISLPATPGGLDLSASGDSLIVALPSARALAVVDLAQAGTPVSSLPLSILDSAGSNYATVQTAPATIRVAANGKAIISLINRTSSGDGMMEVDLGSGRQTIRTDARSTMPYTLYAMGATPDRSRIMQYDFTCPRSYLAATDAFSRCAVVTGAVTFPNVVSFDAAGQRAVFGNVVFDADFNLVTTGTFPGLTPTAAISADGAYLYLGVFDGVRRMRIADGTMLEKFLVPVMPQRLFVSPAGDWMLVIQTDGRATRVDLR